MRNAGAHVLIAGVLSVRKLVYGAGQLPFAVRAVLLLWW